MNVSPMYPRLLEEDSKPFDPVWLAKETEKIVTRGKNREERKYTDFYTVGVYGGISTGYACGCCLRCCFCWVDLSREYPESMGSFYSPKEAYERLSKAAKMYNVRKLRISGAEPTLGKEHLLSLLEYVEDSDFSLFILETNGILFGIDKDYVKKLKNYKKVHVRVSLKAGTPEKFSFLTGAIPESFEIPFDAIKNLLDYGVRFHVAAMTDPRIMNKSERNELIDKLKEIDPILVKYLEEEIIDPYSTTLLRMKTKGFDIQRFFRKEISF
ncbi:MAG: radical SAM protein [Candidatus Hydrothermarchaeota archaeon]